MNFVKNNKLVIIILLLAITGEYLHLLFIGKHHSVYVNSSGTQQTIYWDDIIYYFTNELFTLVILVFLLLKLTGKASKAIMSGICFWYLIEFIEITLQMLHISTARLIINDGSWLQIFTCFFVTVFAFLLSMRSE